MPTVHIARQIHDALTSTMRYQAAEENDYDSYRLHLLYASVLGAQQEKLRAKHLYAAWCLWASDVGYPNPDRGKELSELPHPQQERFYIDAIAIRQEFFKEKTA